MTEITFEGGIKIKTFKPPHGFNPLTADAAEVVARGFPERPKDPHHLERYERVLGQLKDKFQYIEPTFRVNSDRFHGPRQRLPQSGTETSSNWSGGVVYAPAGQSFKWIEGDWVTEIRETSCYAKFILVFDTAPNIQIGDFIFASLKVAA
jgi:hypothetical protein